jgi:hypothetical protein
VPLGFWLTIPLVGAVELFRTAVFDVFPPLIPHSALIFIPELLFALIGGSLTFVLVSDLLYIIVKNLYQSVHFKTIHLLKVFILSDITNNSTRI